MATRGDPKEDSKPALSTVARELKSPISPIQSSGPPKSRSPSPKPKSRSPESTVGKTENALLDMPPSRKMPVPSRKMSVRTAERVRAEYPDFDTRRISLGTQEESRAAYPYFDEPKALVKFVQERERYNPEPPTDPPSSSDTAALNAQEESLGFDENHKYFRITIRGLVIASCLLCPISIIFSLVALYFATLEWHFRIRARQLWRTSKKWNTLSFVTSAFWASMYAIILIYVGIYYLVREYHRAGAFDEDNLNPELNQTEIVDTMDINSTLIQ